MSSLLPITPIVFPDTELLICSYLRTQLPLYGIAGVYVSNQRQTQPTAVWVRRDGGGAMDQVREQPRVGINCYAPKEQAVTDLARTVSALMVAMPDGKPVVRVDEVTGPTPIADTSGPRRYLVFELILRGVELHKS
jgi:hypothetical protein